MKLTITLLGLTLIHLLWAQPVSAQEKVSDYFNDWLSIPDVSPTITTIPDIINKLVPLIIVIAGTILLIMLIAGGFKLLTSAANPDSAEAGKKQITTALIGFVVVFAAYWIIQIFEVILGVKIFGTPP